MTQFAKLFETDQGQILIVQRDDDEGNPAVIITFKTEHGNFMNFSISFDEDTDEKAQQYAEKTFNIIDVERAIDLRNDAIQSCPFPLDSM